MKKSNPKSQIKSDKKTTHKNLKDSLIAGLKEIAAKHNIDSKKAAKEINKAAKHLTKALSKEIKTEKTVITPVTAETETAKPAAVKTEKLPVAKTVKPAAKAKTEVAKS